jgi:hypothetical protein
LGSCGAKFYDVWRFWAGGEVRPRPHQLAADLEHVAAAVRRLDLVADSVSERHFGGLAGKIRLLSTPMRKLDRKP